MDVSRRRFFLKATGDAAEVMALRPPWSGNGRDFMERCTRCGDCASVCETRVIQFGADGYPRIDFSVAGCTLCGRCVTACQPGVLRREGRSAWEHQVAINDSCLARQNVECRMCGESCDAGAIRFRLRQGGVARPELNAEICNGCGECVGVCPTRSINPVFPGQP